MYIYIYTQIYTDAYMYICVCTHMHMYMHMYIYIYTQVHTMRRHGAFGEISDLPVCARARSSELADSRHDFGQGARGLRCSFRVDSSKLGHVFRMILLVFSVDSNKLGHVSRMILLVVLLSLV